MVNNLLKRTDDKYICRDNMGRYSVRKWIKSKGKEKKLIFFAAFENLDDALKYRDYCVKHDWDMKCRRKRLADIPYISPMELQEGVKIV